LLQLSSEKLLSIVQFLSYMPAFIGLYFLIHTACCIGQTALQEHHDSSHCSRLLNTDGRHHCRRRLWRYRL